MLLLRLTAWTPSILGLKVQRFGFQICSRVYFPVFNGLLSGCLCAFGLVWPYTVSIHPVLFKALGVRVQRFW